MTMMQEQAGDFAALAVALYAAHHVGDYWVQTHHQSMHKGDAGAEGVLQCTLHVLSYLATQVVCVALIVWALGVQVSLTGVLAGLAVSGVTHYLADRREHGLMFKLVRRMPWKAGFLTLGAPRRGCVLVHLDHNPTMERVPLDNPSLGTGAWALDQAWHIFWGVFVAALLMAVL